MGGRRETKFEARPPGTTGSEAQAQHAPVPEKSFWGQPRGVERSRWGAGRSQLRGAGRTKGSLLAGELCAGESCRGGGEMRARKAERMCAGRKPAAGEIEKSFQRKIEATQQYFQRKIEKIEKIFTGWLSRLRCVSGGEVEEVRIEVTWKFSIFFFFVGHDFSLFFNLVFFLF